MILPMLRVELIGPRERLQDALRFLQQRAALELRAPPDVAPLADPAGPDGVDPGASVEAQRVRVDALAARLGSPRGGRPEPLPAPGSDALSGWLDALERELSALESRRAELAAERDATARFARLVVALAPLGHRVDPALEPEVHGLVLRGDAAAVALLEAEVGRLTGGACEVKARPLDDETTGVLVVVPRASSPALAALLSAQGVDEVRLPSRYSGRRLVDVLLLLAERERELPGELARAEEALAELAHRAGATLAAARVALARAAERRAAISRCGGTRFAFVIEGYVPAERIDALRADAARELGPAVAIAARPPEAAEREDVPVVLRNPPWLRPFERLLALVALPRYGSVDPTPWLAVFFPLFFGLVLGDIAFGALGIAVALLVRRAGVRGQMGRDLAWIALWCSVSALVFGVLFGEALGEVGAHMGLRPLLVDRRRGFMTLLGLTLGVGAVHVATGMLLGTWTAVRHGHLREATARAAKLVLLAAAVTAAASAVAVVPRGFLLPAVGAAAVLVIVASIAEGPLAILELVLGLGNVLSYARLMALGLASVMLAEVANHLATALEPAAAGLTLSVLLHAVNFSLGLISPAIASLRLQYVEFFEKFYDEGGFPFRPLGEAAP